MRESVLRSIENLNIESIDLCYLHQNELLVISNKYVLDGLYKLKQDGFINNIGVSIYSQEELEYVINSNSFDWVQIPVNILDASFYNRIVESGSTIKIAARSVFLQGIIFNTEAIKKHIPDANEVIKLLDRIKLIGYNYNLKLIDLAVAYVCSLQFVSQVIVGTTNVKNLNQIKYASQIILNKEVASFFDKISETNKSWTNPRMWGDNV
jgi:uncharacterized protein